MSVCDLSYLFKFFFKVQRDKTLHLHFLSKNWFKRTHIQSSSDVTLASRVWTNGEYFLPVRNNRASKLSHEARIKMRLNCFLPSIAFRVTNTLLQVNGKLAWKVLNETVPLVTTKRCQEHFGHFYMILFWSDYKAFDWTDNTKTDHFHNFQQLESNTFKNLKNTPKCARAVETYKTSRQRP